MEGRGKHVWCISARGKLSIQLTNSTEILNWWIEWNSLGESYLQSLWYSGHPAVSTRILLVDHSYNCQPMPYNDSQCPFWMPLLNNIFLMSHSQQKKILRNRMKLPMLEAIICIRTNFQFKGLCCVNFVPTKAIFGLFMTDTMQRKKTVKSMLLWCWNTSNSNVCLYVLYLLHWNWVLLELQWSCKCEFNCIW